MKITIVPHSTSRVKTVEVSKILLLLLSILIMIPLIARFFYPKEALDSSKLEETNKVLERSLKKYEKEYNYLVDKYDVLISKVFAIGELNKKNTHSTEIRDIKNIDSLLADLSIAREFISKAEHKIYANEDVVQYIPSIMPTKGFISQEYGKTEYVFTEEERKSKGIDISAIEGEAVYATASGTIEFAGFGQHYEGLKVTINHGYGFRTEYSHLSFVKVRKGQLVKRGSEIGLVGKTGKARGPVLHYKVLTNEVPRDPMNYIIQPVEHF